MTQAVQTKRSIEPQTDWEQLAEYFRLARQKTIRLIDPLEAEDTVVQSMPDVSPSKWHLAHVTWFFEHFILARNDQYQPFNDAFHYLFNSYYYTVGPMHKRAKRGLLSRPTLREVLAYRSYVDDHILMLLDQQPDHDKELEALLILGINHEQQHQELMLTDIKHVLSCNPLKPAYRSDVWVENLTETRPLRFIDIPEGIHQVGSASDEFCFDNETPRHQQLIRNAAMADRLITNAEYLEFIQDGGYQESSLWLSDAWAVIQQQDWQRPLYWSDNLETEFTLAGEQPLQAQRPVCHISYYEADAYARWAGHRLPLEEEWEVAAETVAIVGNLQQEDNVHPEALDEDSDGWQQMFGDVWEWTASPYMAYPGFKPLAGSIGEYNGKFMCNQMVLRGGSCATPFDHIRSTYRNFFYPDTRWQFSGIRLAKDLI